MSITPNETLSEKNVNILKKASDIIIDTLTNPSEQHNLICFQAASAKEAEAIGMALIFARNHDAFAKGKEKRTLENLLHKTSFNYDETTHTASLRMQIGHHEGERIELASERAAGLLSVARFFLPKEQWRSRSPKNAFEFNEPTLYERLVNNGGDMLITPDPKLKIDPAYIKAQIELLKAIGEYHGFGDILYHHVEIDPKIHDRLKENEGHKTINENDIINTKMVYSTAPGWQPETIQPTRTTITTPKQPKPFDTTTLGVGFNNLKNSAPQAHREEAYLITHAVETLAAALDMNNELHQKIAEMLLSKDNIYRAACDAQIGKTFDNTKQDPTNPREKATHNAQRTANVELLKSDEVRAFLEAQSEKSLGLLLLLKAALSEPSPYSRTAETLKNNLSTIDSSMQEVTEAYPAATAGETKAFLAEVITTPSPAQKRHATRAQQARYSHSR